MFWRKPNIIDAWQTSEYSPSSEYTKVLNMIGLHKVLKKCCIIDDWQDFQYSRGSEYASVLNRPGLHKALDKMVHYRYLIEF